MPSVWETMEVRGSVIFHRARKSTVVIATTNLFLKSLGIKNGALFESKWFYSLYDSKWCKKNQFNAKF